MTQTVKKQDIAMSTGSEYYKKFYKSQNGFKAIILDYLFRNISFSTRKEKIRVLNYSEYKIISNELGIPVRLIHKFISNFLVNLVHFKKFLNTYPLVLKSRNQERKVQIYLHKIYRLAPVFNYKRAQENSLILRKKLDYLCFWPQFMTQIAVILFITDLLDQTKKKKILQSNLRMTCCCSAYAFHRSRNKIGLTAQYVRNL
ncbi:MAG: hypothetical protein ACFE88_17040 [Candidatus Hermodarchaeota archaeon]